MTLEMKIIFYINSNLDSVYMCKQPTVDMSEPGTFQTFNYRKVSRVT